MRVDTSDRAEKFIRLRGGTAYVWLGESGLCAKTERPQEVPFEEVLADGYRLFVDTRMAKPPTLLLRLGLRQRLCAATPASTAWLWRAIAKGQDTSELHGG